MADVIRVFRYDRTESVRTNLDPIEDLAQWISGLRSIGLASDLLKSYHGIADSLLKENARTVADHATTAVDLLDQAFSGPSRASYLPLYYAFLNLAKICVIASGQGKELQGQRLHGVSYRPGRGTRKDLLHEKLTLKPRGALSLFYRTLAGQTWGSVDKTIQLDQVYPFIQNISHEYHRTYGVDSALEECTLTFEYAGRGRKSRLVLDFKKDIHRRISNLRTMRITAGFAWSPEREARLTREITAQSVAQARAGLFNGLRRFLLYDAPVGDIKVTVTPVCTRRLMMPEEIPILLAFYHLGSVVRYSPDALARLEDSRVWGMLLVLRRHATFRYLNLFWSYVNQAMFFIAPA